MRWQGGRVVRWERWKVSVLFRGGRRRVSSRFHLFVYDVHQGTKGGMGSRFSCVAAGMERTSLDLPDAVNNG